MNKLLTTIAISLAVVLASAAPARAERFVVNGDLTVTDTSTGLMWTQGQRGAGNWSSALGSCEALVLAGYSDWRLPNVKELFSLYDLSQSRGLDPNVFYDTSNTFWSSTTLARYPLHAFGVSYVGAVTTITKVESGSILTRCVR